MAVELRPTTAVLVLLGVLAAGSAGSIIITEAGAGEQQLTSNVVPLDDDQRQLWLYTSQARSFDASTLAINTVVYGDPNDVRRLLLTGERGTWNETGDEEQDVAPDRSAADAVSSDVQWDSAAGARRFVFFLGPNGGTWLSENYQLHDGDYLGSRHHIRAYTPPGGDVGWTAMQAHYEHWDWFMARHVVTSSDASQAHLEQEFLDEPGYPEISRVAVGGAESGRIERWLTVVDFREPGAQATALLVLLLGTASTRLVGLPAAIRRRHQERDVRALFVAAGIVALLLSVRLTGVGLERILDVPPKLLTVVLYPFLFAGLPIGTYLLSRPLDRTRAFSAASLGFIAAVLVDYTYLGVTHVSLNVLVHRGALAMALGMIAIGSSQNERLDPDLASHVRVGVLLWLVATALPLLQHTRLPV